MCFTNAPFAWNLLFTSGSLTAVQRSALTFRTIGSGVPVGASITVQAPRQVTKPHVPVHRLEIYDQIRAANASAAFRQARSSAAQNTGERSSEAFNRSVFPEGHPNRPHTWSEFAAAAKTAIFDQMTQTHIDFMLSKIPKARFVKVEELAAMVSWLASEDCAFSTGAVFDISGGRATY